jgi:hypothetical protein
MRPEDPNNGPARLISGFLSLVATSWVTGWLFGALYNELSKPLRRSNASAGPE